MEAGRHYPLTPPPGKRSFPPKCVTKPELRDEGAEDVISALKIAPRDWNLRMTALLRKEHATIKAAKRALAGILCSTLLGLSAWGAGMNLNHTQLFAGKGAVTEGADAWEPGMDAAETGAGEALAADVAPGKLRVVKAPGKAAPVKKEQGKGAEDRKPPDCVVFSALDILVRHLTRAMDGAPAFSGEWREVFLQALARAPIVTVAARIAGVTRARALEARMADAEFAQRWDDALEEGVDEIEAAAFRSAVYGEEKPVYHQGEVKGWTVEYSHAMRSILLKSKRPEVFDDQEEPREPGMTHMTLEEFRQRVEEARKG